MIAVMLYPTTHAGSTSPVRPGTVDHSVLYGWAYEAFLRYKAQRPQVEFGAIDVEVLQSGDDVIRDAERAVWRARSRIRWS